MSQVLDSINKTGPKESIEPRLMGEILWEYFSNSNEPLAVAFRERKEMGKVKLSDADNYGTE